VGKELTSSSSDDRNCTELRPRVDGSLIADLDAGVKASAVTKRRVAAMSGAIVDNFIMVVVVNRRWMELSVVEGFYVVGLLVWVRATDEAG